MRMPVSTLDGAALEWAVRSADGFHRPATQDGIDWSVAGPLIEREGIGVSLRYDPDVWDAVIKPEFYATGRTGSNVKEEIIQTGSTPLEAAMRCFVEARLGKAIDLPDDLTANPGEALIALSQVADDAPVPGL